MGLATNVERISAEAGDKPLGGVIGIDFGLRDFGSRDTPYAKLFVESIADYLEDLERGIKQKKKPKILELSLIRENQRNNKAFHKLMNDVCREVEQGRGLNENAIHYSIVHGGNKRGHYLCNFDYITPEQQIAILRDVYELALSRLKTLSLEPAETTAK